MGQNNFVIRVVEPGDTPVVPNTGLFGQNINGIATAILTPILILISISVLILFIKKIKKTKVKQLLNHNFKRHFKVLLSKRSIITSLSILAIVAASATFVALKNNSNQDQVNAEGDELSITAEDISMEIELGDKPVYAEASSTITVNTATPAGYTLSAYVSNQELQPNGPIEGGKGGDDSSSAPSSSSIDCEDPEYSEYSDFCEESGDNGSSSAIDNETNGETSDNAVDEIDAVPVYSTSLKPNTWGIALADPGDESSTTFRGLPDKADDALVIKVAGTATEAGDTTEVYYGAYITPDLPAGEYVTTVNYVAVAHPDVAQDDITVNYYSNGLTFPDGISNPNTVVYGNRCKMAYVGSYCTTAYKAKNPVAEETIKSIKETADLEPEPGVYVKYVTVPDAESLQVAIDYTTPSSMIIVTEGEWDGQGMPSSFKMINPGEGHEEAVMSGDTVTLAVMIGDDEDKATFDIYPTYNKAPADIETEEVSVCKFAKSDNVNDEGEQQGPYTPTYDTSGYNSYEFQRVSVPGAEKVKVDLQYGFTKKSSGVMVIRGDWDGDIYHLQPDMYEQFVADDENISGEATITFNGDSVWFLYLFDENFTPESGFDFGFYARIYSVYDDDHENTIPFEDCYFGEKKGKYVSPENYKGSWVDDGGSKMEVIDGDVMVKFLESGKTDLAGKEWNLYVYNPYAIIYNGNGATAGTMVGTANMISDDNEIGNFNLNLIAPNFKKDGYGFAGWSLDPNAEVNNPNYTIYGPNQTVTQDDITASDFKDDGGKTATLYAVWVPTSGELQNWNGCSAMATNQVIALSDNRDNNVYTVAKLADGNCWMTENLRLDNTATITAENTDHPAEGFVLPESSETWYDDCEYDHCGEQPRINTNNTNIGGKNSLGDTLVSTPGYIYDNSGRNPIDYIGFRGNNYQWYSYGNYYNWNAATAGTGDYSSEPNDNDRDATGSICPAGWNLPSKLELNILLSQKNNEMKFSPKNFMTSGYVQSYQGSYLSAMRGYDGGLWLRTRQGSMSYDLNTYYLYVERYDSDASWFSYLNMLYGLPVRCVKIAQ